MFNRWKQTDENGDFYEFKFEWEEREDEIELFDFESGPSDFSWKQRNSPLDVEDKVQEVWDLTGKRDQRTTVFTNQRLCDDRIYFGLGIFIRGTLKGNNVKNLTDFKFDGLAWSNNKDFSVMFDGLVDIGVGYFNNMGKQESVHLP